MKLKVSGVPYEVDMPDLDEDENDSHLDDMIATLEQENKFMRARMERLEQEIHEADAIIQRLTVELSNLKANLEHGSGKH